MTVTNWGYVYLTDGSAYMAESASITVLDSGFGVLIERYGTTKIHFTLNRETWRPIDGDRVVVPTHRVESLRA